MRKKNILVFDFDGTVFNSFPASQKMLKRLAKEFKLKLPTNNIELKKMWGTGGYNFTKYCFPNFPTRLILKRWRQLEKNYKLNLIRGTEMTIQWLKQKGCKAALITNRSWKSLERYRKLWEPLNFDFIQAAKYKIFRRTYLKPHPIYFKKFFEWLKINKINPKRIFYIGDCAVDFETVKNVNKLYKCNIEFVGVLTGVLQSEKEWHKTIKEEFTILPSIVEIPSYLLKIKSIKTKRR